MPQYVIKGVEVQFPYDAYGQQVMRMHTEKWVARSASLLGAELGGVNSFYFTPTSSRAAGVSNLSLAHIGALE